MRQYYIIFLMIIVSGEDLVHSCVRSLNAACELVSGNSRECRVTCNTLEKIENVDTLQNKTQHLEQRMTDMEKRFNKTQQLEQRMTREEQRSSQVNYAFYAELTSQTTAYEDGGPIIFTNVKFNVGLAYNSSTGRFVTPANGTYYFSSNAVMTDDNTDLHIIRERNGSKSKVCSMLGGDDDYGSLTVSCVLNLETDDQVYVEGGDHWSGVTKGEIRATSSFYGFLVSANW